MNADEALERRLRREARRQERFMPIWKKKMEESNAKRMKVAPEGLSIENSEASSSSAVFFHESKDESADTNQTGAAEGLLEESSQAPELNPMQQRKQSAGSGTEAFGTGSGESAEPIKITKQSGAAEGRLESSQAPKVTLYKIDSEPKPKRERTLTGIQDQEEERGVNQAAESMTIDIDFKFLDVIMSSYLSEIRGLLMERDRLLKGVQQKPVCIYAWAAYLGIFVQAICLKHFGFHRFLTTSQASDCVSSVLKKLRLETSYQQAQQSISWLWHVLSGTMCASKTTRSSCSSCCAKDLQKFSTSLQERYSSESLPFRLPKAPMKLPSRFYFRSSQMAAAERFLNFLCSLGKRGLQVNVAQTVCSLSADVLPGLLASPRTLEFLHQMVFAHLQSTTTGSFGTIMETLFSSQIYCMPFVETRESLQNHPFLTETVEPFLLNLNDESQGVWPNEKAVRAFKIHSISKRNLAYLNFRNQE